MFLDVFKPMCKQVKKIIFVTSMHSFTYVVIRVVFSLITYCINIFFLYLIFSIVKKCNLLVRRWSPTLFNRTNPLVQRQRPSLSFIIGGDRGRKIVFASTAGSFSFLMYNTQEFQYVYNNTGNC